MGKYSTFPDDAALERIADGRVISYVQQNSQFYIAALEPVGGLRVGFAWRVPCEKGTKKPYWELCVWSDAARQVVVAGTPCVGFSGCSDPIKWSKSSEAKFAQIRDALLDFAVWQSEDAIKAAWSKMYDFVQTQLAKHFAPTRMWRVIYETSGSYDLPVYVSTWRKSELAARKFAAKRGAYVIGEYSPAPPPWERDTQDCEPTDIATDFLSSDTACKSAYGRHENGRFCLTPKGVEWDERLSTDEAVMMPLYFDLWSDTPELPFFTPGYPTELVMMAKARGLLHAHTRDMRLVPTVKGLLVLARARIEIEAKNVPKLLVAGVRNAWCELLSDYKPDAPFDRFRRLCDKHISVRRLRHSQTLPVGEGGNTLTPSLENWEVFGDHAVLRRSVRMWEIYRRVPAGPKWAGLHAWQSTGYMPSDAAAAREVAERLEAERLAK